jgi:hypothetical protein
MLAEMNGWIVSITTLGGDQPEIRLFAVHEPDPAEAVAAVGRGRGADAIALFPTGRTQSRLSPQERFRLLGSRFPPVMPGPAKGRVPGIHVFFMHPENVDGRDGARP